MTPVDGAGEDKAGYLAAGRGQGHVRACLPQGTKTSKRERTMDTMIGTAPGATKPTDGAALVKNSDTKNFMADVIEASRQVPVIVDFWAPWCGPCKQLGPALEKAVPEAKGAVKLVKINIDENPEIAQQMRIQSIPAVYAFKAGRPIDGFVGALPDSQVKQFIQKLAGAAGPQQSPVAAALEQAKAAIDTGDSGTATA